MQHQGYYRALPAANLRRFNFFNLSRLFDISQLLLSNEVKNDYSTSQKQQRRLDGLYSR